MRRRKGYSRGFSQAEVAEKLARDFQIGFLIPPSFLSHCVGELKWNEREWICWIHFTLNPWGQTCLSCDAGRPQEVITITIS